MNAPIVDPLQGDFPEVIEEFLEHGIMKCISFNRRGTLLAAGCTDGGCVIWDFETRGIAKELRDKECTAAITSVCWSKYGHRLLASASDKSLTLWDVFSGEKIARTTLQQTVLQARLHPGSSTPSFCLACPLSSAPLIVDLNSGNTTVLPILTSDEAVGVSPSARKPSDGSITYFPCSACFSKYGNLVYAGNSKGEILIIDHQNVKVRALIPTSSGATIKNIVFDRRGQYLLTNSSDRTIRIYENLLPSKESLKKLDEFDEMQVGTSDAERLKIVGGKYLALLLEFQDSVTRIQWKVPCFSGDGEWVIGASASRGEHKIYIWDKAGSLVKILEGPKEALMDLTWHPVNPIIVSVSLTGLVYIWAKDYTENWSAFAPDFKELEENEEYVEREDEFDMVPETEKVKASDVNEDDEIDIMTVEKDSAFSDSDMSQDELCFLPVKPCPGVPEQQDKCVESSSKLPDGNHTTPPLSVEAGQDGQLTNHTPSSPFEAVENSTAEDAEGMRLKRRRRPSEKGLELQVEKVKKPSKPMKSSGKLLKPNKVIDPESSNGNYGGDVSDD